MKKLAVLLFLIFSFLFFPKTILAQDNQVEIYYSRACSDCLPYLEQTLIPELKKAGLSQIEAKDFISRPELRPELDAKIKDWQVPTNAIGHMMAFITLDDKKILLAGHAPPDMISNLFSHQIHHLPLESYPLGIWQDEMHGEAKFYRIWMSGQVTEFPIQTSLDESLPVAQQKAAESNNLPPKDNQNANALLPTVLISGFLDGLNPCAFAVLLFLVAFIFMLKKTRTQVFLFGLVYIAAIYLAYLLIGLGLWKAIIFTGTPHFMAKFGSILVILLGLINIKDYLAPKLLPVSLRIPWPARFQMMTILHKGTLPTTFVLGFLVGLCTFPCSGGIYVAIVSLLASKVTSMLGLFYLVIYNLMFVLPLLLILSLAGNRFVTEKLTNLQEKNEPRMRFIYGILMILIGVIILAFFV